MTIIKINSLAEAIKLGIGGGTLETAKHAFAQGKSVYVGVPDGKPDDIMQVLKGMKK